jgi:hypothetical protein
MPVNWIYYVTVSKEEKLHHITGIQKVKCSEVSM